MKLSVLKIFTALASVGLSTLALAHPIYLGTPSPVTPVAGSGIPLPHQVPGKEFTNFLDQDLFGVADPLQNVAWDGLGKTADSDDFDGAFPTFINNRQPEIDATANRSDALFDEVVTDQSALLVSVEGDPGAISVWSHARTSGAVAVWATQLDVDSTGHIKDLDALEVWGPDLVDDSNRLSLFGDPGGISIWDCVLAGPTCTPTAGATTLTIALALASSGLDPLYGLLMSLVHEIDLDALMYDENVLADDSDDRALFSLRPIHDPSGVTILDGGEVFLWKVGAIVPGSIAYLSQGGHLWDRANDVTSDFKGENVDALEAVSTALPVPEPATLALMAAGMLGLGLRRRRRSA